jgi:phytoene dehydrogenase-like protein
MEKKKIIIIGGGVTGLSAGIYAQLNGFDSRIIEMHNIAGGLCTAWHRKKYKFDYSIQWLVGTRFGAFHETYKETNILNENVKIIDADFHSRVLNENGEDFLVYTNIEKWESYLLERAPEDKKAIKKMCRDMRRCSKLEPFDLAPALRTPFHYIRAFFRSYPTLLTVVRYKNKRCEEYFDGLDLKNEWLKNSLHNIYGKVDFSIVAFLLIIGWYIRKNAGYPVGGSLAVAERMHQKYTDLGGILLFKKRVSEIIETDGQARGVLLEDGTKMEADYVISAADGYTTLYKLLKGKFVSNKLQKVYEEWEPFSSFVQVSFGLNMDLKAEYPVQWILSRERKIGSTVLSLGYRILNYNFDPTMAPEGKTCIIIRFESPWDIWKNLSEEEYAREKEAIERDAIRLLEENYPGSSSAIEVCDIATPKTTVRYTGAWKGAYEGFKPSSKNIIKQLSLTLPGINNFYMAGQWLFPGGGIPPSVQSGKWAIQMICKKERQKFKNKN